MPVVSFDYRSLAIILAEQGRLVLVHTTVQSELTEGVSLSVRTSSSVLMIRAAFS